MKRYLYAFSMTQSMFCRIPWPFSAWDPQARKMMLLFLPVIGLEVGAVWMLGWYVCELFALSTALRGLILCAIPFLMTGFIHLDGYMDVTDAVGSCRDLEKRRIILKDSHVGAFAVIGCSLLLLAMFACGTSVERGGGCLLLIPVVSRCGSALAVTILPAMSTSQYAGQKTNRKHVVILCVMLTATLVIGFCCFGTAALSLLVAAAGYALALRRGYHGLEGMNGDISGYALTLSELAGLAALAFMQGVL